MLSQEKLADLRAMIVADDSLRAMGNAGNDAGIAASLNAPSVSIHRKITKQAILRWAASTGGLKKLRTAIAERQNGLQAASEAALAMLSSELPTMAIDAEIVAMLDALVAGGVLAESDKTAFLNRAAETVGEAEYALGQPVTDEDVSASLAGDRPNGKLAILPTE